MNYNRSDAAEYLGVGIKTMDNWRVVGTGPRYLKLGSRVLYPQEELDAFKAKSLRTSTSSPVPALESKRRRSPQVGRRA